MTLIVNIHKAKTNLSELIQRVESGDEIIIARDGTPVARLVGLLPKTGRRLPPGIDAGKVIISPDFDDPLDEFNLE